ncbi:AAA family ATPase [bacterium]|nr:MAG: AAA family ATPase [bacterium]
MSFVGLPSRTTMVINANKLKNYIKDFKAQVNDSVEPEHHNNIYENIKSDGCSILVSLIKFNDIDTYNTAWAYTFLWFVEFSPDWNLSSDDIISKWDILTSDDTVDSIKHEINTNSSNLTYLKSIYYIINKANIKNEIAIPLRNALEALFLDFFGFIVNSSVGDKEEIKLKFTTLKNLLLLDYSSVKEKISSADDSIDDVLNDLNKLIGITNIKEEVKELINFINVNQLRKSKGLPVASLSLHTVFAGPPGTGKTTVARIMGRAYKALGLLSEGHIIETDRSDLVAGYIGQTAIKTKSVLEKALNGILFIDEAYTLSSGDEYGQEAIDTILKYMEDNRSQIVIIVAGYEDKMKTFLDSNPGIQSRFLKYIHFPNYTARELLDILSLTFTEHKFIFDSVIKNKLLLIINDAMYSDGDSFGNARFVRNLYERIIQKQFNRVSSIKNPSDEEICTIIPGDVE